ncbi:MAG TPA: tetratricopeptide repeat protein [Stellaceae bacterium]|nr:tetratricopeptide repeat protein [Stellaceae bacterium]
MVNRSKMIGRAAVIAVAAVLAACGQAPSQGATTAPKAPVVVTDPIATESALGSYLAGSLAQQEHAYGPAAEYLERALKGDPDNADLLRRAFLLRLSGGDGDRAAALAKRLVAADPRAGLASLVLLIEQVRTGDDAGAASAVDRLPIDGLLRFSAPLITAWVKAGQHDQKAALTALDQYDKLRGFDALKEFHLALIDDYLGDVDGASQTYKKVLGRSERLNWRTADIAGRFLERHGRAPEAKALYERFLRENRDSADLVQPALARIPAGQIPPATVGDLKDGVAEALFDLASVLNGRDTQDLALVYARLALQLSPKYVLAQLLIAEIAEAEQRPAEALAVYRAVDPGSPLSWSARLRAAEVLDQLDRTDEAVKELTQMATERPDAALPLIQLGDILRGRNRFAEAVTAYDGAVTRSNAVDGRNWSLYYSRGIALERSGQWPRAEADFMKALDIQKDQPLVLNYLGYSWVEKREHLDKALKMIERAVELRPNDGYIVDSLGWAHFQLGDYPQATQYLERAIELLPEDPTINDHLGDAYWRSGRLAEARYQWHRALQFQPEADEVKTIDAKLDKGLAAPPATSSKGG